MQEEPGFPAQGPTCWCFLVSASTSTGTYRDAPVLSIGELWSPEYFNTRPPGVLLKRCYHVLPERRLQGFRGQCQLLLGVSETHTPQAPLCVTVLRTPCTKNLGLCDNAQLSSPPCASGFMTYSRHALKHLAVAWL